MWFEVVIRSRRLSNKCDFKKLEILQNIKIIPPGSQLPSCKLNGCSERIFTVAAVVSYWLTICSTNDNNYTMKGINILKNTLHKCSVNLLGDFAKCFHI